MQLAAARIFVWDVAEAKTFYTDKLGLVLTGMDAAKTVCIFDTGNTKLIVESIPRDAPEDDRALVGRFTGLSFAVADVQAHCKQLEARGVKLAGPPEQQSWGGWLATFEDPAGNRLQFVQTPIASP